MQQQIGPYSSAQYFRALSILCIALIAGVTLFSCISIFLFAMGKTQYALPGEAQVFAIVALSLACICLFAGITLYKKRMLEAKELSLLSEKLNAYRAALILFYALLEGPALFSVISFFETGELKLFLLTGAEVLLMILYFPNKQRVIKALYLSSQEEMIINDPDGVIE
ncbi:MAG TPA: hypothetical protein VG738_11750 [Chitinophagaceae bacterium]|nr:hypothetical protein [Chitinophagaceae bacterium]